MNLDQQCKQIAREVKELFEGPRRTRGKTDYLKLLEVHLTHPNSGQKAVHYYRTKKQAQFDLDNSKKVGYPAYLRTGHFDCATILENLDDPNLVIYHVKDTKPEILIKLCKDRTK